jgi:spore coat protein U-like protein
MIAMLFLVASEVKPAAAQSCSATASGVVFGNYTGSTVDVAGTITVTCTSGTAYSIGLDAGTTPGSKITNRQMTGASGPKLAYQLFNDAARTINWGNTSGTNWVTGTGTGNAQLYTIYAQIPASQKSGSGSYMDTITASITGSFTTATTQFTVTTVVVSSCTVAATALNFGAYTGTLINSTSTVTVNCTSGGTYDVGLDAGTATGATVTNRSMTGPGGALLGYNLFQDAALTLNWGNTVGTDTLAGTATGSAQLLTVYGQLPGNQTAQAGSYSDTITVTITY